ncbi:hypothetical protein [Sphingorhabdus sp.]|uniref:hypothetical protein n=1 Tax=Sphingorhabdus sp. TaxID=1902408 RepID=UPI003982EF96
MITIYDSADMARVITGPIDPNLKTILQDRLELLSEFLGEWDLGDLAHFIVVEPSDSMAAIETELGLSPFVNLVDDVRYPDPAFEPSWETCLYRQCHYSLTFALSDTGLGLCLIVPDRDDIDPQLLELCRAFRTQ